MPGALALGLVGGALELYGASKTADAAKKAAKQETAASQQGLNVAKQVYAQQQQNLAPYQQMGTAALGNLQGLAAQPIVTQNPGGFGYSPRAAQPPPSMSLGSMGGGNPMGGNPMNPNAGGAMGSSSIPMASQAGSMVLLRAPTGEVQQVPANQAQQFIARGATVVN